MKENYINEIRIMFDQEMLDLYKKEYFRRYPTRKKFDLKAHGMSLNEFTAKTRMVQAGYKVKYAEFVQFVLEYNNIPKAHLDQCTLEVLFTWKDRRRRDHDNYSLVHKFYLDAIVKYGLLKDDNYSVINSVTSRMSYDKNVPNHQVEFVFKINE